MSEDLSNFLKSELKSIREKQEQHSQKLEDMRVNLEVHKAKTGLIAMILGAVAGFLAHLFTK